MDENNNEFFNDEKEEISPAENENPTEIPEPEKISYEPKETTFSSESSENKTTESYVNNQTYTSQSNQAQYENFQPYTPPQTNYTYQPYYQGTPDNPKKQKSKKGLTIIISIIAAVFVFAAGFAIAAVVNNDSDTSSAEEGKTGDGTVITNEKTPDTPSPTGDILSSVQIAEIGRASSVGVVVYSANSSYFSQSSQSQAGEGTGIVAKISEDGKSTYILTCAHVISDKGVSAKILLEDGTTYDADIVGFDQQTDVGVLKVKTTDLKCAEFGDFKKLKVGSPVYAVGNPGGAEFFGSVTNGIVSSISRSINNEIGYTMDCIQHNAAINPGNSGGSLLNEYGQVIGINSSKIASTEYEGMSFAIPISTALKVANELIANGYVPDRPKLGITYSLASSHDTYAMIVQIKGLPAGSLIIRSISPDSDLANQEVREGDMITAVNGKDLDTPDALLDIIDKSKVGDSLKLKICRISTDYSVEEFEVTVKLVEDKGSTAPVEEETTYINPFDYFDQFGGYGN
ncbi:MAG: trypsin-like peptidase domain-containing protein [Clostridia bacterium]|nr:trypsin-like peptidase domain-containing protein [Clostridia bacterium]